MNADKRRQIYARLRAANPKPTTELEYTTPFELLVAVILSAQATDKSVNAVTRKLFPVASHAAGDRGPRCGETLRIHPHHRVVEGQGEERDRHGVGYRRQTRRGSPRDRAGLEALPGVGRKLRTSSSTQSSESRQ